MTTPPEFKEPAPSTRVAAPRRVTVRDVAEAGERAAASKRQKVVTEAAEVEHATALADFAGENPDWSHAFEQVSFEDMVIDPSIQRPENPLEIAHIARNFNPMALGMVTLWRRLVPATETETEYYELVCIDGQQRRAGAQRAGYTGTVHADVHENLTRSDAARLFRQLNDRKPVQPIQLFRIALVEGDEAALAVMAVLDGLGISFGTVRGYSAAKGSINLVKRRNGVTNLEWALRQVKKIYDRGAGGVYDGGVVEAFFLLHERYGNRIDEKNLFDKLATDEGTNSGLVEYAKTLKRVHKGTLTVNIIRAIIDRYNKGKHKGSRSALPDWE